jgi:hypothetical protein
MKDNKDIENLENRIEQMIQPLKSIPFNLIIKLKSGFDVEFFDSKNELHSEALNTLNEIGNKIVGTNIESSRPNEVGNKIEQLVLNGLNGLKDKGVEAGIPKTQSGKMQSTGYPDIEFKIDGKVFYLECKTFGKEKVKQTFRTFYFSPSKSFKITSDAVHFLIAFEIIKIEDSLFQVKSFKILSLNAMLCDLKSEFNSSNKIMYSGEGGTAVLFESSESLS